MNQMRLYPPLLVTFLEPRPIASNEPSFEHTVFPLDPGLAVYKAPVQLARMLRPKPKLTLV